jgi:site-specific DNA recombinase
MSGITRFSARYWADGPDYSNTYYTCRHDPADPRHTTRGTLPRTISVREDLLLEAIRGFFATHVFGPDRRELLAASMPDTAADDRQQREKQAAALRKRLRQIDTAENAQAREIETLAHLTDPNAPALVALRARILARFTELEDERTQINTKLTSLDKTEPKAGDPALLDKLPILGDILADAPVRLQQELYQAFDLQALYKKNTHQVSISVTITDSTPAPSLPSSPPQAPVMAAQPTPLATQNRLIFRMLSNHLSGWCCARPAR